MVVKLDDADDSDELSYREVVPLLVLLFMKKSESFVNENITFSLNCCSSGDKVEYADGVDTVGLLLLLVLLKIVAGDDDDDNDVVLNKARKSSVVKLLLLLVF